MNVLHLGTTQVQLIFSESLTEEENASDLCALCCSHGSFWW